jgi:hypothetical protein
LIFLPAIITHNKRNEHWVCPSLGVVMGLEFSFSKINDRAIKGPSRI